MLLEVVMDAVMLEGCYVVEVEVVLPKKMLICDRRGPGDDIGEPTVVKRIEILLLMLVQSLLETRLFPTRTTVLYDVDVNV